MNALITFIQRMFRTRMVRVLFVGGIGFCIQTFLFELLGIYYKVVSPSTAAIIGGEVAILCNFYLNNAFSFNTQLVRDSVWLRIAKFHMVVSVSLAIQWLCIFSAEHVTSNIFFIHAAYASGVILGFVSNYIGYSLWVWKKHEPAFIAP